MLGELLWSGFPSPLHTEPSCLRLLVVLGGKSHPCGLSCSGLDAHFCVGAVSSRVTKELCFLQGLTESQDAEQASESTFTSER